MKDPILVEPYDPDIVDKKFLNDLYKNASMAYRYVEENPNEVDRQPPTFKSLEKVHVKGSSSKLGVILKTYLVEQWSTGCKDELNSRKPRAWLLACKVRWLPTKGSTQVREEIVFANTLSSYDKVVKSLRDKLKTHEEKMSLLDKLVQESTEPVKSEEPYLQELFAGSL